MELLPSATKTTDAFRANQSLVHLSLIFEHLMSRNPRPHGAPMAAVVAGGVPAPPPQGGSGPGSVPGPGRVALSQLCSYCSPSRSAKAD